VQVGAGFEQVGGEAMAEHVGIDTFLNPGAAGGFDASVVGRLVIHGVISTVPAVAGKKPDRLLAQTSPVSAQFLEQDRAEHDVAVLMAFAVLNVHDHASAIDVADLQARELGAPHAGAVEGHQNGAIEGSRRSKKRLWREQGRQQLESFRLAPWASRRRRDLLELLDRLNPTIAELSQAIEQQVEKCPEAQRLMTHPGVGPLTALGFMLIIGKAERFQCGKQVASYLGLVPLEDSSGNRRRLGHITKQGSSMLRFFAGKSGAGYDTQYPGMAQQVFSSDDVAGKEDRKGGPGAEASHSFVLDVAQGMGLRASEKVRFARRTARKSRWCAVQHRVIDWASCSPITGSLN